MEIVDKVLIKTDSSNDIEKMTKNHNTIRILDRIIINTQIPQGQDSVTALTDQIILTKRKVDASKRMSGFVIDDAESDLGGSIQSINGESNFSDMQDNQRKTSLILPQKYLEKLIGEDENSISLSAYKETSLFGTSNHDNRTTKIASIVVGCTLGSGEASLNTFEDGQYVQVQFENKINATQQGENSSYDCVYWDVTNNIWSKEGCEMVTQKEEYFECRCNHLTNLAVLFSYQNSISKEASYLLDKISQIFMGISIACFALIVISFLIFTEMRKNRIQQVIFGMSVSLLITYILFLMLIEKNEYLGDVTCQVGAVLMHYFLLSAFCWTLVEALVQYFLFVKVLGTYVSKFMLKGK